MTRPVESSHPGWLRRIVALCADWALSALIVIAIVGPDALTNPLVENLVRSLAFLVQRTVLISLLGWSIGQRIMGIGVARLDGRRVGPGEAFVRTLLTCLAIPPLVVNRDGRGLHDVAAGTVVVRI